MCYLNISWLLQVWDLDCRFTQLVVDSVNRGNRQVIPVMFISTGKERKNYLGEIICSTRYYRLELTLKFRNKLNNTLYFININYMRSDANQLNFKGFNTF